MITVPRVPISDDPIEIPPIIVSACHSCHYRAKSHDEASEILREIIKTAHMTSIKGGGTLVTARIDMDTTIKFCLWEVECEDCEDSEGMGDSGEPHSQWADKWRKRTGTP